jgi:hypothetical protein
VAERTLSRAVDSPSLPPAPIFTFQGGAFCYAKPAEILELKAEAEARWVRSPANSTAPALSTRVLTYQLSAILGAMRISTRSWTVNK